MAQLEREESSALRIHSAWFNPCPLYLELACSLTDQRRGTIRITQSPVAQLPRPSNPDPDPVTQFPDYLGSQREA